MKQELLTQSATIIGPVGLILDICYKGSNIRLLLLSNKILEINTDPPIVTLTVFVLFNASLGLKDKLVTGSVYVDD